MKQTYHGSCHCGRVQFEADIDLSAGTGKCNCSICWKTRAWGAVVSAASFRLLAGADALTDYRFGAGQARHTFCATCGVHAFRHYPGPGGREHVSVNLACLDDLDPATLAEAPVRHFDGRGEQWDGPPAETRHL